jgi:hypothetical protein
MPPAPTVRDLQALIAEQTAALKPQQDIIDQSITSNDTSGAAQEAGLSAQKTTAFKDITQGAQNKGMYFSGFSPDEEAKYTAGTYLPALAQLQSTIAQTRASLLGKKADLNKGAFDVATQQHENDRKTLADWNAMTADQQFKASQADKDRAFNAQQNLLKINADARNTAAQIASKATPDVSKIINSVGSFLHSKIGSDGKVSPATFQAARQQWAAAGGSPDSFAQTFYGYVNTGHVNDYF